MYKTYGFFAATIVPRTPLMLRYTYIACHVRNSMLPISPRTLFKKKRHLNSTSLKTGFLDPRILTNISIFSSLLLTLSLIVDVGTSRSSEVRSKSSSLFLNDSIALIVLSLFLCSVSLDQSVTINWALLKGASMPPPLFFVQCEITTKAVVEPNVAHVSRNVAEFYG